MLNFNIGLSGIHAAEKAFDIIGNNIANAATEGYHRQDIDLSPLHTTQTTTIITGGGVEIKSITRAIDGLLEQEILRQDALLEHISQEHATLSTVENALGELSLDEGGLSASIDNFFGALQELCAHPAESIWQNQVISAAQELTNQFRTLGEFLDQIQDNIKLEADNLTEQANLLINKIAELNDNIEKAEIKGGQANNLRDQRDNCITQLSKIIGVQTLQRENGVTNVTASGVPLVTGTNTSELEVGFDDNGDTGLSIKGAFSYHTNLQGGKTGGLLSLRNTLISNVQSELDTLANAIIQNVNNYHVEGVGSYGSFTELSSLPMSTDSLADYDPSVSEGTIYIRVIDTSTNTVTRNAIDISSSDSLSDVAAEIDDIDGITAVATPANELNITANPDYEFDFLPGVLTEPNSNTLNGDAGNSIPDVNISGIYTGTQTQTYTCTVLDDGQVGNTQGLEIKIEVGGQEVRTIDVGKGYAAGDRISIGDGIYISLGTGVLNADETFTIEALADSDTSKILAAIGMNTFFSGSTASDIAVRSDIIAAPGRIATSIGQEMTDNTNAARMYELKDQQLSDLSNLSPPDYYNRLVTRLGQQLNIKKMRQDNVEVMVQNLNNQKGETSGVNINDEAAKLLVFEQMFQAMSKYLGAIQNSLSQVMAILDV